MKPRILITGSSGFIGGAFARLIQDEFDVYAIGRHKIPKWPDEKFIQIDIIKQESEIKLIDYFRDQHFHAAIHFAAATPHSNVINQLDFYLSNTIGTLRLLQAITGITDKFAYISTVDVFGINDRAEINELSAPKPNNNYSISKYLAEMETQIWSNKTETPIAIFRLGQVYGPRDPSKKAIPNFCRAVVRNRPIVINGTGQEIRQPIYIQDVISAIKSWVEVPFSEKFAPYLLVGYEQITIHDLAETISKLDPQKKIEIIKNPPVKQEIHQLYDNKRTRQLLNWQPIFPLTEGLKETLLSMQSRKIPK